MIEIANASILSLLVGAVVFLLIDRRRINASLEEKDREGIVTQAELDSYHHRVVQLYQTQRDWSRGKFEEADHRLRRLEKASREEPMEGIAPPPVSDPKPVDETDPAFEIPRCEILPSAEPSLPSTSTPDQRPFEAVSETVGETESFATAEEKVLKAWTSGLSIDQIAQELRMGRQEVQLLIQVSRRRPVRPVGA